MYKLNLTVGDRVRNIRQYSSRKGMQGVVAAVAGDNRRWVVIYNNGLQEKYLKSMAHVSLEKVDDNNEVVKLGKNWNTTKGTYKDLLSLLKEGRGIEVILARAGLGRHTYSFVGELARHAYSKGEITLHALRRFMHNVDVEQKKHARYVKDPMHMHALDFGRIEDRVLAHADLLEMSAEDVIAYWKECMGQLGETMAVQTVHDEIQFTPIKRRTLKKVRRNVINGKTQDDYVRDCGHARGVQQFNTRCLGLSTGQALRVIGDAMCNPTTEIRISGIDHAISDDYSKSPRNQLDKHFKELVKSLIGNMKGFTFTNTHIVFNPIVTEETYVEKH